MDLVQDFADINLKYDEFYKIIREELYGCSTGLLEC